jgi:hypothetical protein
MSEKKFVLTLSMNTDDDCRIIYKQQSHCMYDRDLRINQVFDSLADISKFLKNELQVPCGDKASAWTRNWLDTCADDLSPDEMHFCISGNQKYDIWVDEVAVETLPRFGQPPHITEEYLAKNGTECPICHCNQIEGGNVEISVGSAFQEMHCTECEATWTDQYILNDVRNIKS